MRLIRLKADIHDIKNRVTESKKCEEKNREKRNEVHFPYILPYLKISAKKNQPTTEKVGNLK